MSSITRKQHRQNVARRNKSIKRKLTKLNPNKSPITEAMMNVFDEQSIINKIRSSLPPSIATVVGGNSMSVKKNINGKKFLLNFKRTKEITIKNAIVEDLLASRILLTGSDGKLS